ncbi:hypothetical protein LguiB_005884 [Lonicera macranthoides]
MMTTTTSPPTFQLKEKIDLTDKESQIFELLLQVVACFSLQTQIRVVGGWVRDKLLGQPCNDIDIALDNMLGTEFTEKVNEYLSSLGKEKQKINQIPRNPEQSKHLETAKMHIDGIEIDFVNLRSEDYSETSRIPVVFGQQLPSSLIALIASVDFLSTIQSGIQDLRSRSIATPLPPKQTFLDDPLRVLRAIRFGVRFGFILDEDLKIAASDHDVKAALARKITRDRIGHEINLMISGKHPDQAMTYIWDVQIFSVIFSVPHQLELPASEERLCVAYMSDALRIMQIIEAEDYGFDDEERRLLLYAALLLPFRKTVCWGNDNKKDEMVVSLHNAAEKFMSLIPHIKSAEDIRIAEIGSKVELTDFSGDKLRMLADLEKIWEMKSLLNGNDIINVLDLKGGVPLVGELQKMLVEQQLLRRCRNRDECIEWLKQTHPKCSENFDTVTKPIDRVRRGNQQMKSKMRKQKEGVGG